MLKTSNHANIYVHMDECLDVSMYVYLGTLVYMYVAWMCILNSSWFEEWILHSL